MGRLLVIYCIDIDGTICSISVEDYSLAEPYEDRIEEINKLYKRNKIIFHTARGSLMGQDHSELTIKQLKKWGVNYHEIVFGKLLQIILMIKLQIYLSGLRFNNENNLDSNKELVVLEVVYNHQGTWIMPKYY